MMEAWVLFLLLLGSGGVGGVEICSRAFEEGNWVGISALCFWYLVL